jgi:hypothetical protein
MGGVWGRAVLVVRGMFESAVLARRYPPFWTSFGSELTMTGSMRIWGICVLSKAGGSRQDISCAVRVPGFLAPGRRPRHDFAGHHRPVVSGRTWPAVVVPPVPAAESGMHVRAARLLARTRLAWRTHPVRRRPPPTPRPCRCRCRCAWPQWGRRSTLLADRPPLGPSLLGLSWPMARGLTPTLARY